MSQPVKKLTIEGFKSIRKLENFELRLLNVLIGANGAGKSNFVSFFRLLRELIEQRLQLVIRTEGGADAHLYLGPKVTKQLAAKLQFGANRYEFKLVPTVDNRFVFSSERTWYRTNRRDWGSGHDEAKLKDNQDDPTNCGPQYSGEDHIFMAISSWVVYHFHDTTLEAGSVARNGSMTLEAFGPTPRIWPRFSTESAERTQRIIKGSGTLCV